MQKIALYLFVLWTLTLAGCQSKAAKVKQLQDQYNAEYPAYASGQWAYAPEATPRAYMHSTAAVDEHLADQLLLSLGRL